VYYARVAVLSLILLAGLAAWFVLLTLSEHDAKVILAAFIAGAVTARLLPPLWRWADRN
jgi:hypothetical protein